MNLCHFPPPSKSCDGMFMGGPARNNADISGKSLQYVWMWPCALRKKDAILRGVENSEILTTDVSLPVLVTGRVEPHVCVHYVRRSTFGSVD